VLLSYSNAPIPLPPTSHNETHLFVFELTSPNGKFVGHLKDPPAHHMQSFHPLNLKIFYTSFPGRTASRGLLKFGNTPLGYYRAGYNVQIRRDPGEHGNQPSIIHNITL
jgi:hypothetical protein